MTRYRTWVVVLLIAGLPACTPADTMSTTDPEDPFLWLEEVEGDEALEWVEARNAETMAALGADERYTQFYDRTFEIITSTDRIATPIIRGDTLYNFWTDAQHPRGIYRRTSWESYLSGDPEWELVLDIDQLASDEGVPWDFDGMNCREPENRLCLVRLSSGGSDAVEVREFDLVEKRFLPGGFRIPESKLSTAWVGPDTVLVASALDGLPVTTSGYAASVRLWVRGTPFEEAPVVTTVAAEELGVFVGNIQTPRGYEVVVSRQQDFYTGETYLYRDSELRRLEIPEDAAGFFVAGDQLVVQLVSDWEVGGLTFSEGTIVSAGLEEFLAGERDLQVVIEPGGRSTIDGVTTTRDYLLVNRLTDVQGQLLRFAREGNRWVSEAFDVPPMGAVTLGARSDRHNRFFFTFSSFLRPATLYLAEEDGSIREVRTLPDQFDAAGLSVAQQWATSEDGTEVPYFLIGPEDVRLDGENPTLLYAYGGFQISEAPSYLGATGKNWVEAGGVYVLANIRGGGEFGPAWWRAALLENRQRAYDDFIAVSEDVIARGVTSPDHLGIMGGSNGGLLVGVAMTQRPDLYDAVVVQVPLLDMRRYHLLLAGASWMAEYGNPDIPEQWAYIGEYSPYQNLREDADYPTPFIWTTTRDDRVHPGHARKMAARMLSQGHTVHYFENTEGGHGSGVTPEQRARSSALTMSYLYRQLVEDPG